MSICVIISQRQREKLANQTILVHRKKYAVGLFWQPVSSLGGGRVGARRLAHSIDGKYSLYVEYNQMLGLASRRSGYRRGMSSAAADIADVGAYPPLPWPPTQAQG